LWAVLFPTHDSGPRERLVYARAVPDRPLVHRRTAVVGAFGGLAATVLAAGCETGNDLAPPSDGPTPSTSATTHEQTPDEALVDDVLEDLAAAVDVVVAARAFRAPRQSLAPLLRAHRAHVDVLEGEIDPGSDAEAPTNADAALLAVRRSERALQASLVDAAQRAESGALARLLASMSASVSQHLAVLPAEAAP
jgi:hypothetical protein